MQIAWLSFYFHFILSISQTESLANDYERLNELYCKIQSAFSVYNQRAKITIIINMAVYERERETGRTVDFMRLPKF